MKLAVLGESQVDEDVTRLLVDALLGSVSEPIKGPSLRSRGWPSIRAIFPAVIRHLHFQTDAEALAVIVDSNHSVIHDKTHEQADITNLECRLCTLQRIAATTKAQLPPRIIGSPLKIAIGLTVPALEAWLRCGADPHVTEAMWIQGMNQKREPYTKLKLKQDVYGTDRASMIRMRQRAVEESLRLALDLPLLETNFPGGFGPFARAIRKWQLPLASLGCQTLP